MRINTSLTKDEIYLDIIEFLKEIKIVRGGQEVYYTLRNHPKIRSFLEIYQKEKVVDIEKDIDNIM